MILGLFGRLEVNTIEHLEGIKGPVIFACNHTSESDPIFVPATLPMFSRFSPIFYTSRERSFYKFSGWRKHLYGGLLFKIGGAYPVQVGLHDYEKSLSIHIDILRDGGSICIFPEGKKRRGNEVHAAKGGVAYLSYITGAPIVPVSIAGVFDMSFADFFLGRRHIDVTYGKPIYSHQLIHNAAPSPEEFKGIAGLVMSEVYGLSPDASSSIFQTV